MIVYIYVIFSYLSTNTFMNINSGVQCKSKIPRKKKLTPSKTNDYIGIKNKEVCNLKP